MLQIYVYHKTIIKCSVRSFFVFIRSARTNAGERRGLGEFNIESARRRSSGSVDYGIRRARFSMTLVSKEENEEEEHYGDAGSKERGSRKIAVCRVVCLGSVGGDVCLDPPAGTMEVVEVTFGESLSCLFFFLNTKDIIRIFQARKNQT